MQAILDWITVNSAYAGLIVFIISCVESLALVGILIPGMALMLGVGTLVGLGVLPFWPTMIWAVLGAISGDAISFWLGRRYNKRLHKLWPLSRYPTLIPKGEAFFHKHGALSIFFGRFIGPLRAIVPAVAGMMDMPPIRFYAMNILSAVAWAPVVLLPGAVFGAATEVASDVAIRLLLLAVLAILFLWLFVSIFQKLLRPCLELVQRKFRVSTQKSTFFAYMLLILLIISSTLLMLTEKSAKLPGQYAENRDRHSQWLSIVNAYPEYNIHYSGNLSVIRQMDMQSGWYNPTSLTIDNALQWLAPDSPLEELPLYFGDLKTLGDAWTGAFVEKESIDNEKSVYILSIKIDKENIDAGRCFGVGRIQKLSYQALLFGVGIPKVTPVVNIPRSIIVDLAKIDGLEITVHRNNNSDLLTISGTETVKCGIKNF